MRGQCWLNTYARANLCDHLYLPQTIEKPLSSLVASIAIPPDLLRLVLDSQVSDAWFPAVEALDGLLVEIDRRKGRVRAVAEVEKVADGLKHTVRARQS